MDASLSASRLVSGRGTLRRFILSRIEPDTESADSLFKRAWALALLDQVLVRLRESYEKTGKGELCKALEPLPHQCRRNPLVCRQGGGAGNDPHRRQHSCPPNAQSQSPALAGCHRRNGIGTVRNRRGTEIADHRSSTSIGARFDECGKPVEVHNRQTYMLLFEWLSVNGGPDQSLHSQAASATDRFGRKKGKKEKRMRCFFRHFSAMSP